MAGVVGFLAKACQLAGAYIRVVDGQTLRMAQRRRHAETLADLVRQMAFSRQALTAVADITVEIAPDHR